MTKRYKQAREDYEYLKKHHGGDAFDISGGFVLDEHCFMLMEKPTKTQAAKLYEGLVEYSLLAGFENSSTINMDYTDPDLGDEQVREIYERHGLL